MEKVLTVSFMILLGLAVAAVVAIIVAFPVMLLWNALMPQLFELTKITFWQAFGLVLLVRFLFGTGSSGNSD